MWSSRPFPSHQEWGMGKEDFELQLLSANGQRLMYHVGEYVRSTRSDGCNVPTYLTSDAEPRDVQSAIAFADGFSQGCPARSQQNAVLVANGSLAEILLPIASDHFATGCGPSELDASLLFGNDSTVLTALHREEIDAVNDVLGCCAAKLCSRYGLRSNCTIADLPTSYTGPSDYWDAMYTSPLTMAAYFAETFMLQALSGLDFAWGAMDQQELARVYELHELVMRLSSSRTSSESFGSALLAYVIASFEQVPPRSRVWRRVSRTRAEQRAVAHPVTVVATLVTLKPRVVVDRR